MGRSCICCHDEKAPGSTHKDGSSPNRMSAESLYEDVDWVEQGDREPLDSETQQLLQRSIMSLRKASSRMTLSRIATDPMGVREKLQSWLKNQAWKLDQHVGLIEVFAGQANLLKVFEARTGNESIRSGSDYGHDFTRLHDRRCLLLLIGLLRSNHV